MKQEEVDEERGFEIYDDNNIDMDRFKKEEQEEEVAETETDDDARLLECLTYLRSEHFYCLYCGCTYENSESLNAECPGLTDDDH